MRPAAEALFASRLLATPVDGDWRGCASYRLPEIPATGDVRIEIPPCSGRNDHTILRLDGVWYEWWPGFEPRPMRERSLADHGL
jgi:hypothetical protein